jgi:hypothetical protein
MLSASLAPPVATTLAGVRLWAPRWSTMWGGSEDEGRLNLRGYIGIPLLGSTQVWSRFTGPLTEDCRFE